MKRLFAVYLGGQIKGGTIEAHDVVFAIAPTINAAVPQLRRKWCGIKSTVHVDSYVELAQVDGFDIVIGKPKSGKTNSSLTAGPTSAPAKKLYFINVGSYRKNAFGELHDFFFLVGSSQAEVKARAKTLIHERDLVHVDNFADVDDLIEITTVDGERISLVASATSGAKSKIKALKVTNLYWPIGKP